VLLDNTVTEVDQLMFIAADFSLRRFGLPAAAAAAVLLQYISFAWLGYGSWILTTATAAMLLAAMQYDLTTIRTAVHYRALHCHSKPLT
jgi:hypothetical protein